MVVIPTPKSKKSDQIFIKFDCGLILSLFCQIKQSSYVKGGTHPKLHRILRNTPRYSNERRDALALWEQFNKTRNDSDEIYLNGRKVAVKSAYADLKCSLKKEKIGLDMGSTLY